VRRSRRGRASHELVAVRHDDPAAFDADDGLPGNGIGSLRPRSADAEMLEPASPADDELGDLQAPATRNRAHVAAAPELPPGLGLDNAADHRGVRPQWSDPGIFSM